MDQAIKENNKATIARNQEEQHRYLTWRAEKVVFLFHQNQISL